MVKRKNKGVVTVTGNKRKREEQGVVSVKIPQAVGNVVRRTRANQATFSMNGDTVCVVNTEMLSAVNTTAAVAAGPFSLIPAQLAWLNGVAVNYQKWRWRRLRVLWVPACPTTTLGQFVLGLRYDQTDSLPATIAEAQQDFRSVSGPYWAGYEGASSMHDFKPPRDGAVTLDVDTNQFGSGNGLLFYRYLQMANFTALSLPDRNNYCPALVVMTHGGGPALSTAAGALFCHYEVELAEPIAAARNN